MDPVKVAGVHDWPTQGMSLRSNRFFGFVNFYRQFIQDFSHVAKPLHQLTKKGEAWKCAEDKWKAFEELNGSSP